MLYIKCMILSIIILLLLIVVIIIVIWIGIDYNRFEIYSLSFESILTMHDILKQSNIQVLQIISAIF